MDKKPEEGARPAPDALGPTTKGGNPSPEFDATLSAEPELKARPTARVLEGRCLVARGEEPARFTLQFASAYSLRELFNNPAHRARLTPAVLCRRLARVARLLDTAHQQGLTHRDLRPEVIAWSEDGSIALTGWERALSLELTDEAAEASAPIGTPGYMPPEQARREVRFEPRSDLFSLGVILYEGIAGRPPFTGANHLAMMLATMEQHPPPLSLSGTTAELSALCAELLEKAVSDRPASAAIVARALEGLSNTSQADAAEHLSSPPPSAPSLLSEERPGGVLRGGDDRYQPAGEVARGGLGRIIRAHDQRLRRPVAIKELLRRGGDGEVRFWREAMLTARLEHPSIMPIHDAGQWANGEPYYTMKLVDGQSFDKVIAQKKTLAERLSLLPHVIDVCEAMSYAHTKRIIHRDLKPQNILLGSFGETIVIDWGLAKDLGAGTIESQEPESEDHARRQAESAYRQIDDLLVTQEGAIMGTPAYMPPEQAKGARVDARADVYSLGAILYTLISGAVPYKGRKSRQVLLELIKTPPPGLEDLEPEAPKDLLTIVSKSMSRNPAERYPTARELVEDLKKFQTGQLVGAHQYSLSEMAWRFLRRYRAVLSVAGVAAALLLSVGALSLYSIIHEKRIAEQQKRIAVEQKERAEQNEQKARNAEQEKAKLSTERTLSLLRTTLERDPALALSYLKDLIKAQAFNDQPLISLLAADAASRGVPRVLGVPWAAPFNQEGHQGMINRLAISPDGQKLASAGSDGTLRLWDTKSGQSFALVGHSDEVVGVLFSLDGKQVVSSSYDGTLRLWDASTHQGVILGQHPDKLHALALSPDGNTLASGSRDGTIILWDLHAKTKRRALNGYEARVQTLAFSPNGAQLAAGGYDGVVRLWDMDDLDTAKELRQHTAPILTLAFSPDSSMLASGGIDFSVILWSASTAKALRTLDGSEGFVLSLVFSPDSETLASSGTDNAVRLWDTDQCQASTCEAITLRGHTGSGIQTLAFSPDGETLASGGGDAGVRLWEIEASRHGSESSVLLSGHQDVVANLAFFPDGKTLASTGVDATIRLWDLSTLQGKFFSHELIGGESAAFSPNGAWVASSSDTILYFWEPSSGARHELRGFSSALTGMTFSPDGERLAAGDGEGKIHLFSLREKREVTQLEAPKGRVWALRFSPDGKLLASAGDDGTITLWEVSSLRSLRTLRGHTDQIRGLDFSPDGETLASASVDRTVRLWGVSTGKELGSPRQGGASLRSVAFSPDGARLAAAGERSDILLWDLSLPGEKPTWSLVKGHKGAISQLSFSPAGDALLSAGLDRVARLWSLEHLTQAQIGPEESRPLFCHGMVLAVGFSPNGESILLSDEYLTRVLRRAPASQHPQEWLEEQASPPLP